MRNLKLIEHIALDGVIQIGPDDDGGVCIGFLSEPHETHAFLLENLE